MALLQADAVALVPGASYPADDLPALRMPAPVRMRARVVGRAMALLLVLAVICSALAFLLMVGLIAEIGPVKATTITYVNPAVAIIAGVLVLGERVTVWTIVGFVLVLAGSYLVTKKRVAGEVPAEVPDPAGAGAEAAAAAATGAERS